MPACDGGNPVDSEGRLCPRCRALGVLEPGPAATEEQIRSGPLFRSAEGQPAADRVCFYITVESTRAEVLDLVDMAGAPTASTADKLVYGRAGLCSTDGAQTAGRSIGPIPSASSFGLRRPSILLTSPSPPARPAMRPSLRRELRGHFPTASSSTAPRK